ncbi:hypothetical protein [Prosthecobacter sp.]|uniref:hypothetical protein n=1 Tax=Prosthecobacter sp. TaxID=1965333 RepID=UPI003783E093
MALLAATTIGGVLATRMGKTPFLLAASAAAIALLRQKRVVEAPAPVPTPASASAPAVPESLPPPPAPELDIPAQNLVEQWLSQQIRREEQAPMLELSAADLTPSAPEDDYRPEAFLLDEAEETASGPSDHDSFARLTEPVPMAAPAPATAVWMENATPAPAAVMEEAAPEPAPVAAPMPEAVVEETAPAVLTAPSAELEPSPPPPPSPAFQPSPFPPAMSSAWTLGVDPLPSLNEPAPYVPPAGSLFFSPPARPESAAGEPEAAPPSSLFFSAPKRQEEVEPPRPVFSTQMFQGAAFPDEISVSAPAPEAPLPAAEPPAVLSIPELQVERVNEPPPAMEPPAAEAAPEIEVEFAAPGEASFDPPLAAAPPSPWQPGPEVFAAAPAFPVFPSQTHTTTSPMVEAEIILRPRAPTQNSVVAKSKPAPFAGVEGSDAASEEKTTGDTAPSEPLPAAKEPKSRPSWLSWWRGD